MASHPTHLGHVTRIRTRTSDRSTIRLVGVRSRRTFVEQWIRDQPWFATARSPHLTGQVDLLVSAKDTRESTAIVAAG